MRVFLDTNILVSAFTTRGVCSDILREVLVSEELLICLPLLNEVKSVLSSKFKVPEDLVKEIVQFLNEDTLLIEKPIKIQLDINDKDDEVLLGYALSGKATVFVTGDKEIQELKKVKNFRLISPRKYWELISKKD